MYTGIEEEDDWTARVTEQLAERYVDMIVSGHDEYCLWRKRGCDGKWVMGTLESKRTGADILLATIYRLPLSPPSTALGALRHRYDSLAVMGGDLPSALSLPSAVDMGSIIQELGAEFFQPPQSEPAAAGAESAPPPTVNEQALALALFGWQAEDGHISGLAVCEACFRRLGLWLFKRRSHERIGSEATGDEDEAAMSRLDVIGEHRDYCPWVDASSQNGDSTPQKSSSGLADLAGWELLSRVIRNTAHLNGRILKPSVTPNRGPTAVVASMTDETGLADKQGRVDVTAVRDSRDKERWTKLRKLRQVFHVKDSRKLAKVKGSEGAPRPSTAG